MDLKKWAENEVKIACKRERGNAPESEWDYGCACYKSALKAFEALLEDGHSGMSIGITKKILNRLIDGDPLTPIEDKDFFEGSTGIAESECYLKENNLKSSIQCYRMSSLFRQETNDGLVSYLDVNRVVCHTIGRKYSSYHSSLVSNLINKIHPITMPYSGEVIDVYCEDFLFDEKNGDFDTVGIFYYIKNGEKIELNKFYKLDHDEEEITLEEYEDRKKCRKK